MVFCCSEHLVGRTQGLALPHAHNGVLQMEDNTPSSRPEKRRKTESNAVRLLSELASVTDADSTWAALAKASRKFRSIACSTSVRDRAEHTYSYEGRCHLRVDRILSRRRHQREAVGCVEHVPGADHDLPLSSLRFARGEFRFERVMGSEGAAGDERLEGEHCELHMLGDDA